MKRILGLTLATFSAGMLLVSFAQAGTPSRSHTKASGALVTLRKTTLGSILVDAQGRTLYLFEKDRNGLSMCSSACTAYWPKLVSHGAPRAGAGVKQALLKLGSATTGGRQVLYAGHPLYMFVGDKNAGQTSGQGLTNFGAGWYVIAANGQKIDRGDNANGKGSGSGYGSGGSYGSGSGW